jgi:hypothetical protein
LTVKKTTRDYNRMEKKQAKRDGATPVKNSGRGHQKGDALIPGFMIDYKFNAKSFQLTLDNWRKLSQEAWKSDRREPVIGVKYEDGTMVAIVDWQIFRQYLMWEQEKLDYTYQINWEAIEDGEAE